MSLIYAPTVRPTLPFPFVPRCVTRLRAAPTGSLPLPRFCVFVIVLRRCLCAFAFALPALRLQLLRIWLPARTTLLRTHVLRSVRCDTRVFIFTLPLPCRRSVYVTSFVCVRYVGCGYPLPLHACTCCRMRIFLPFPGYVYHCCSFIRMRLPFAFYFAPSLYTALRVLPIRALHAVARTRLRTPAYTHTHRYTFRLFCVLRFTFAVLDTSTTRTCAFTRYTRAQLRLPRVLPICAFTIAVHRLPPRSTRTPFTLRGSLDHRLCVATYTRCALFSLPRVPTALLRYVLHDRLRSFTHGAYGSFSIIV